jgi:hypothetical protein
MVDAPGGALTMRTGFGLLGAMVGAGALIIVCTGDALFHWEAIRAGLIHGGAPVMGGWLLAQLSRRLYGTWQARKPSN